MAEAAQGPYYGPFETADAAVKFLRQGVNKDWRFYFTISDDVYRIEKIIPHPK